MIKFNYPNEPSFLNEYYDIFNFSTIEEDKWTHFIDSDPIKNSYLPRTLKGLITCQPSKIVDIFKNYISLQYTDVQLDEISFINYDNYSDIIIDFFLRHQDQLNISTCCYCNLTYINIYSNKLDRELLQKLNSQYDEEIISLFTRVNEKYTPQLINKIKAHQPFSSISEFDNLDGRWQGKKSQKLAKDILNHQFDIDHFLPKGECFLTSLSLNNFVPSCQVCNSRIKLARYLEKSNINNLQEKYLPTSKDYNFENELEFFLGLSNIPGIEFASNPDCFYLDLDGKQKDSIYKEEAELFRLKDRYQYHICEVLRYIDNLRFFNKFYTKMMYDNLVDGETINDFAIMKEIILSTDFRNENKRIMSKLFNDIKNQFDD